MCVYIFIYIGVGKDASITNIFQRENSKADGTAMGSFKNSVFILVLHLLEGALSDSLIQLNNNGYEGIVIAIDPNVPEDETLIQHIKVSLKW